MQLVYYALYPYPLLAHAGTHGVHLRVGRINGHLGAEARLPRYGLYLDYAGLYLGNLQLEKPLNKAGVGTGNYYLRALVGLTHLKDVNLQPVAGVISLPRYGLGGGKEAVCLAQLYIDAVLLYPLDYSGKNLVFLLYEFIEYDAALGLANTLNHHLLGGLGRYAAELAGVYLLLQNVAHFIEGIDLLRLGKRYLRIGVFHRLGDGLGGEYLHLSRIPIHCGADVSHCAVVALIGRYQCGFKCVYQYILAYPALFLYGIQCLYEFGVHCQFSSSVSIFSKSASNSSRSFSRALKSI